MTQEDQPISKINSHIEEYLDYYCGLSHAPGFDVLLKGEWGCGKTWFINKYREKLEEQYRISDLNQNYSRFFSKFPFINSSQDNNTYATTYKASLYVSLYGIINFAEIESELLRQLFFPTKLSKELKIVGNFTTELIKSKFKFDSSSVLKNLTEYFDKGNEKVIIFDDLERCKIDFNDVLGYINDYIEHQDSKVIILANEDKLLEFSDYKNIKEKIIGKTFDVGRDLDAALKDFIEKIDNSKIKSVLSENTKLIEEIYHQAKYDNLRSLKQIILDFERIFIKLPKEAKTKVELLQEILKTLVIFSIEIKRATIIAKDINDIPEQYSLELSNQAKVTGFENDAPKIEFTNSSKSVTKDIKEKPNSITEIINIYKIFDFYINEPFLGLSWWHDFFDKGQVNTPLLEDSIFNSKYFADENTPDWIKLWHFYDTDITDDEFHKLLEKVEAEYAERKFIEKGEIIHVTGVFLNLCNSGLYPNKTKQYLLQDAKDYIDDLVKEDKLDLDLNQNPNSTKLYSTTGYKGLGYQGIELEEFKVFKSYIIDTQESALEQKLPQLGLELLDIMQKDKWQFHRMLCINNFSDYQELDRKYYKIPILKHIKPQDFMEQFLSMNFDYQGSCLWTFTERYKASNITPKLTEELEWLKNIQDLLSNEISNNKGKLSGYRLKLLNEEYLSKAIEILANNN